MKSNLEHLPAIQQDELHRITGLLLRGFEDAVAGGTQPWRRGAKIYKIILFGSYARGDFVDEPQNGYLSDFDLLVVVSDEKLTDIADYWWVTEQKILHDASIGRIVNIIVHDLAEVNQALAKGQYFFSEIVRDGVALYDAPGHPFSAPQPQSPQEVLELASDYFAKSLKRVDLKWQTAVEQAAKGTSDADWRNEAAFSLHQSVEAAYITYLLVRTLYFPRSHNIKFLRSLAEDHEPSLVAAWPRAQREDRRRFEHLKRAYVEARYSDQYEISVEELEWLLARATALRDLVCTACETHLAQLAREAGQTP
ncbi:HEPN domain-containing protein [Caulobacter soli]|uniref:HEPN domain-containing protein n=1 Tax=Caulobacter soli TaxID=2708539 RepID=UPI0013EDEC68|nr:HEPN domain-containing protein [Caulobacter soli]